MLKGKIWGNTRDLFTNDNFEVHRIEIKAGYHCSKHKHNYKHNIFYVESGELIVRAWKNDYDLTDETLLKAGDITDIPPGEFHQFESVTDVVALEIYYPEPIHNDIVRENHGGQNG